MKQSLCLVSAYNYDYHLINILQESTRYKLEAIYLTNTSTMRTRIIGQVKIVNNTHTEVLDKCDAIYISNYCNFCNDISEIVASHKEKIINDVNSLPDLAPLSTKLYNIDIPVFLVAGLNSNSGKNHLLNSLCKAIEENDEKPTVISNYENCDLLGYYRFPIETIQNAITFNEKIRIINAYFYYVIQKSKCSILILSIPGGVCNPFFQYDDESTLLMHLISKACIIDYVMCILPSNLWNKSQINSINCKMHNCIGRTVDYWVLSKLMYDSVNLDNATDTNSIPTITLTNTMVDHIYSLYPVSNSSIIDNLKIGDHIVQCVVEKLHKESHIYNIL